MYCSEYACRTQRRISAATLLCGLGRICCCTSEDRHSIYAYGCAAINKIFHNRCKIPPHGALDLNQLEDLVRSNTHFSSLSSPGEQLKRDRDSCSGDARGGTGDDCPGSPDEQHHDNEPADLPTLGDALHLTLQTGVKPCHALRIFFLVRCFDVLAILWLV